MLADQLSEEIKDRVWDELLDCEHYVRYYEKLTNRFGRRARWTRLTIFVGGSFSIAAAFGLIPWWQVSASAAGFFLLATAVDFVWDWGTKSKVAHAISLTCWIARREYATLFRQARAGRLGDTEITKQCDLLSAWMLAATAQMSEIDSKASSEAYDEAVGVAVDEWSRYANRNNDFKASPQASAGT